MSEKDIYTNKLARLEEKVVRNTIANTRDMALKYPRGEDGLTEKQRIFVEIYTSSYLTRKFFSNINFELYNSEILVKYKLRVISTRNFFFIFC